MESKAVGGGLLRLSKLTVLGGAVMVPLAIAPADAAPKNKVTISVVQALAAGEWSTEILAGANAAAKDLGGKVRIRASGPTTFDPQRQVQMFQAELETKPDAFVVVNVAPPLFTQPALDAQARGAQGRLDQRAADARRQKRAVRRVRCFRHGTDRRCNHCLRAGEEPQKAGG